MHDHGYLSLRICLPGLDQIGACLHLVPLSLNARAATVPDDSIIPHPENEVKI
jgi:hypothetical protein